MMRPRCLLAGRLVVIAIAAWFLWRIAPLVCLSIFGTRFNVELSQKELCFLKVVVQGSLDVDFQSCLLWRQTESRSVSLARVHLKNGIT
jgi:hypothetical protein